MRISDLLKMDGNDCIDWLIENQESIVLAPRELTPDIRRAFHKSYDNRIQTQDKGCPDDQWDAMVKVIEET